MLTVQETAAFLREAQDGDAAAKEQLLTHNTPLIKSVIKRFCNKGVDYDDLFQLGSMGFLKAIKNFNFDFNVRFSTYAVPMILGEVKRYLRDDGYIKVSRSLKVLYNKVYKYVEECKKTGTHEPRVEEIAAHLDVPCEDIVLAMDCARSPVSLFEKSGDGERSMSLIDKVAVKDDSDDNVDKLMLKNAIGDLSEREKKIVMLRYFRDMTQGEVAAIMGVSQVQISRLESKILGKLRAEMEQ